MGTAASWHKAESPGPRTPWDMDAGGLLGTPSPKAERRPLGPSPPFPLKNLGTYKSSKPRTRCDSRRRREAPLWPLLAWLVRLGGGFQSGLRAAALWPSLHPAPSARPSLPRAALGAPGCCSFQWVSMTQPRSWLRPCFSHVRDRVTCHREGSSCREREPVCLLWAPPPGLCLKSTF